jgi:nitroreductase
MLRDLACTDSGEAFGPWRSAIGRDGRRDLVHAAVLAANAHNSQPWRFDLSDCGISVHADLERNLGGFDPFRREMHQSLGCAIETLVQAANARGLGAVAAASRQ